MACGIYLGDSVGVGPLVAEELAGCADLILVSPGRIRWAVSLRR
ncbi:Uncharacterised protein [Nocardia brasiliensis]|nr:Uncharacterised protein [Nocardia brasiliensis]